MQDSHKTVAGYLPADWSGTLIKNVCNVVRGSSPRPAGSPIYFNGEFLPWVTVADVTKDNKIFLSETKSMLTQEGAKLTRITEPGTLFLTNSGATLGIPKISKIRSGANDGIAMLLDLDGVDTEFAYYYLLLKTKYFREVLAPGVGQPNLNTELIGSCPIPIPPFNEQQKIAKILTSWDKTIEKLETLIAAKQKRKKALTQQLLTGKKRFAEFVKSDDMQKTKFGTIPTDWQYLHIAEVAKQLSVKNHAGHDLPVLSCTKHYGLVDSLAYFGRQIFSEDTSTYKVTPRNTFAYATNHIEEGSIGYQNLYDEALISPMYTVFQTKKNINDEFLYRVLKTELYRHIFEVNTSASVDRRGSLRWNQFAAIKIPVPSIPEQQKIASCFAVTDKEIETLKNQLTALKEQKKGLMQKLLTGKKRVKIDEPKMLAVASA